jgi:nicotinate dehydrogenase subunit A
MKYNLNVNGRKTAVDADDPSMPLLYALRNDVELHGPRFGCGLGQCGACTVHVDGRAVRSCTVPIASVGNKKIVTLEGLGAAQGPGKPAKLHPLQQAFVDEQAVQCGYCINGMIMQAAALLAVNAKPTDDQIREALAHNLCRCGTHTRIVRAVRRASGQMA